MLIGAWLVAFFIIIFLRFGRQVIQFVKNWVRIRKLVNQFPGPPTVPILGNVYNLTWNNVGFTFQMEYIFRKYAYKNCGIIRFWIGPVPLIFLTRPNTVKPVLESPTLLNKPKEYQLLREIMDDGLVVSSGEKWHTRRRMLTPAFHFKILHSYVPVFNKQAKILMQVLDKYCDNNEVVDLLPILRRFSLDVISETAMGVSVNSQKYENADYYLAITQLYEMLFKHLRYPWLWLKPIWYALGYGFHFDKHMKIVSGMRNKIMEERKRDFENMEDEPTFEELSVGREKKKLAFLDLLLSMRKEHKLSDNDIREEVGTFLITGYDTVSSSTGFVLWLLGQHPEYQEKVYEELHSIFGGSDRDVTVEDMKKMKYTEQCMKESMRMYPTIAMMARRVTEDIEICGYTIPAGVTAVVSPFSVGRDPEQWDDPEVFDPEHFSPENVTKRNPYAFVPFSAGPRNCIGQKFALMEEKVAVATVLRHFKVVPMLCEEENRAIPEISLKPSRGFPMRLIRREREKC